MMRITTSSENQELDRIAESEYGIGAPILMENAGRAAVQVLFDEFPQAGKDTEILVFAGKGNNAGDAFVLARRLVCLERRVRVFNLANPSQYKGATRQNYEILLKMNVKMKHLESASELDAFFEHASHRFTVVDGILGTGLKGDLVGIYYDVVELLNAKKFEQVVALDVPTGVNGDTGGIHGVSLQATLTVSFGFPKLGHFLPPGAGKRGQLVNVDISLPPRFRKEGNKFLLTKNPMVRMLRERDRYGHKNAFGHTLLVGGSPGMLGAISMAARACHRMGTGLATIATWEDGLASLMVKLADETMAVPIIYDGPQVEVYKKVLPRYSSLVVGPGLGKREEGKTVMEGVLSVYGGPMVVDADGLNLIGHHKLHQLVLERRAPTVLTPHPGEMARLLEMSKDQVLEDPIGAVEKLVAKTHAVVVLKGAATLIGATDDVLYLNHYPNDGMATAGSGDVLAGMIGGLLGQGIPAFDATRLGVYLHSLAGGFAAKNLGHRSMTATDIIESIADAFKEIKTPSEVSFPEAGKAKLH